LQKHRSNGKTIPAASLADLENYEAVVKLLVEGSNQEPFRAKMLPPLENHVGRRDKHKLIARSRECFATPRAKIEAKLRRWMSATAKAAKCYWIRIGAAWAHKDGNGFNIQLETAPLDGRISLRVASEKAV
jgi:hypothetical protein